MDRLLDGSGYTSRNGEFFFLLLPFPPIFPYDELPCQHQYQYSMINRTDIRDLYPNLIYDFHQSVQSSKNESSLV